MLEVKEVLFIEFLVNFSHHIAIDLKENKTTWNNYGELN
jgi:hypothetical protein